jgi:DNA phosphorothioation-dependent restriction protein DptG
MVTPAVNTIIKMIEQLPESDQEKVAEHLREYLAELEEEQKWDEAFAKSQDKLIYAAREARKQITEGKSEPMDFACSSASCEYQTATR